MLFDKMLKQDNITHVVYSSMKRSKMISFVLFMSRRKKDAWLKLHRRLSNTATLEKLKNWEKKENFWIDQAHFKGIRLWNLTLFLNKKEMCLTNSWFDYTKVDREVKNIDRNCWQRWGGAIQIDNKEESLWRKKKILRKCINLTFRTPNTKPLQNKDLKRS